MRRAKIICTLGPCSSSEEHIESLIESGMDVARLNFSHETHGFYQKLVNTVRLVARRLGRPIAILQDLQGPKIRTGNMVGGVITLKTGQKTIITTSKHTGTSEKFSAQYQQLAKDIKVGDKVLLDDGKIILKCLEIKNNTDIYCKVIQGGDLVDNKGINIPSSSLTLGSLTKKDIQDAHFGARIGVDAVALSFVRSAKDIKQLRRELAFAKSNPLVIAKIEKSQAVEEVENILSEVDGVMVDRGDLGVEMSPEEIPIVQKNIIDSANSRGKIVIVATEMLESMIKQSRPTRAEASDVANAVLDGADMLMLSAETAIGSYPVLSVKIMDRIIREIEESSRHVYWKTADKLTIDKKRNVQNAASLAAVRATQELESKIITIYTTSGATASLVSDYRPKVPIIAFVENSVVQRRLSFLWGIVTVIIKKPKNMDELMRQVDKKLLEEKYAKRGDTTVLLTKVPLVDFQKTNTVHVHTIHGRQHQ